MRVFNSGTLLDYGKAHADADRAVRELNETLRSAVWTSMRDVQETYPSSVVLNGERAVFHVKGNYYRVIVAFNFQKQGAFIKFVGTHREYDRVDALTVDRF